MSGTDRADKNESLDLILNQLIRTCKDSENGFRAAAEASKVFDLKQALTGYANERALFAAELQAEVERLGGVPAGTGTLVTTLQHGWFNLKSLVTGGPDVADIIAECDRGEDSALKVYDDALRAELPPELESVVRRQRDAIQEVHDRLRTVETVCAR